MVDDGFFSLPPSVPMSLSPLIEVGVVAVFLNAALRMNDVGDGLPVVKP